MVQRRIKKVQIEEEESSEPSFFSNFFKTLKDSLLSNLATNIKENIKEKLKMIEQKIFRNVLAFIFGIIGIIYLSLSLLFYLKDHYQLPFFTGLLIIAIIFLLLSSGFKWLARRG